jgi:hypothetical protein
VDVTSPTQRYRVGSLHFVPEFNTPFSGIIPYLTSEHGGNVHDQQIVNVFGSSVNGSQEAKHAVDFLSSSHFCSINEPNQWLCYDFKNRKVRPTHYSIQPHSDNWYGWIFEGSLDGSTWTELDGHTDDQTMNSNHPIGIFTVSTQCELT